MKAYSSYHILGIVIPLPKLFAITLFLADANVLILLPLVGCCIDSKYTDVTATFNCNYISPIELANVIYELVTKYMNNAIVNIERNGGFGSTTK